MRVNTTTTGKRLPPPHPRPPPHPPPPRPTTDVVRAFPRLSRFGVMKHLEVLRAAGLVISHEAGRQRMNALNATPIRQIYERWVGPFQELWTSHLLGLKAAVEHGTPAKK